MDVLRSSMDRVEREVLSLTGPPEEFRHEALFYAGEEEFLAGTGAFVRDGLESDEPILVVLSAPKIEALRSELGAQSERVHFADMAAVGRNPARSRSRPSAAGRSWSSASATSR